MRVDQHLSLLLYRPTHAHAPHSPSQLDGSLGFAGGVMLAASYWSLLAPAIEMTEENSVRFSKESRLSFLPAAVGFALGAIFVAGCEALLPANAGDLLSFTSAGDGQKEDDDAVAPRRSPRLVTKKSAAATTTQRGLKGAAADIAADTALRVKRVLLLVIAVTIHNFPEGLAVGVAFGAAAQPGSKHTVAAAIALAIGIGIQNFPEGMAVSLPLHREGMGRCRAFWFGQLSGMVEPIGGLLGALAVTSVSALLPYALGFAAGAMVYVVVDDLVPESHASSNVKLANCGFVIGFIVMMSLDVALG